MHCCFADWARPRFRWAHEEERKFDDAAASAAKTARFGLLIGMARASFILPSFRFPEFH